MAFQKITEYQRKIKIIKKAITKQTNQQKLEKENLKMIIQQQDQMKMRKIHMFQNLKNHQKKEKSLYSQIKLLQHIVNLENSFFLDNGVSVIYDPPSKTWVFKILEHTPTLLSQYVSSVLNVFKKQIPSKIKIPMQLCELYGETKQIYIKSEEFVILDIGKWIFDQMFNEVNNQILKFLKHQKGNKILIPASSNPAVDLVVQLELEDGSMKHYIMQMKHYLKSKISEKTKTNFKKNANLFVSNMHKLGMSPKTTQFLFIGTMDKNPLDVDSFGEVPLKFINRNTIQAVAGNFLNLKNETI